MNNTTQPRSPKGSSEGGRWASKSRPEDTTAPDLSLQASSPNGTSTMTVEATQQDMLDASLQFDANKQELQDAWDHAKHMSELAEKAPWWKRFRARSEAKDAWHRVGELNGKSKVLAAICDNAWESHVETLALYGS